MHTHPRTSKPFLRWSGGKTRLLPQLLPLLPSGRRLIEPFVGAGSVFLATDYPLYVINDANADLVDLYRWLKEDSTEAIAELQRAVGHENFTRENYAELRFAYNSNLVARERARLFFYLNQASFNGLYRLNRRGDFNVPFGREKPPEFPAFELQRAAIKLEHAQIHCGDFEPIISAALAGDVVYCDPPYSSQSPSQRTFVEYLGKGFHEHDHIRLVDAARNATQRGATVLISNHDSAETRDLYQHADKLVNLQVRRSIAAKASARAIVDELVAVYLPR